MKDGGGGVTGEEMERETRFELATSTLARLHSTTELFPLMCAGADVVFSRRI